MSDIFLYMRSFVDPIATLSQILRQIPVPVNIIFKKDRNLGSTVPMICGLFLDHRFAMPQSGQLSTAGEHSNYIRLSPNIEPSA
ncbi:hypothetical protein ACETRX_30265 [Labrys portucalensis]|uniref:Uncharacterized protein n=1 Tax=Labrys neptuniae TaxID=376174 RepID=A0ABV6ZP63_9HYPH